MPVEIKCQQCGNSFYRTPKAAARAKYCSTNCQHKSFVRDMNNSCEVCGKQFYRSPSKGGKYCSHVCAVITRTNLISLNCKFCNKEISVKSSRCARVSYCSKECMANGYSLLKSNVISRNCDHCKSEYLYKSKKKNSKFCSVKCCNLSKTTHKLTDNGEKICRICNKPKPTSEFYLKSNGIWYSSCKHCHNTHKKADSGNSKNKLTAEQRLRNERDRRIILAYGINLEEYERLLKYQDNKCAVCLGVLNFPHIDHCHTTGKVRGLLCKNCNSGIGFFKDSAETLLSAIKYLNEDKSHIKHLI